MTTMNEVQLTSALHQFTGTETWFRHEIFRHFTYTEGVQFLAEEAGAYWLVDQIFGLQYESEIVKKQCFQFWKLKTENGGGKLICEDGDGNEVFSLTISYTDFPLKEISLYFTDNVLLLPSEY